MTHIVGIDFGSTNTIIAYADNDKVGNVRIITDKSGNESFPSVVSIKENGEVLVGYEAQKRHLLHPEETFFGIKRLLGTKVDEKKLENHPGLVRDKNSIYAVVGEKKFSLEFLLAAILKKAKNDAETYFGENIEAVVTVPAYFSIPQRHAVMKAGKIAGLKIRRIISEPVAAAVAYGYLASEEKFVEDGIIETGKGLFKARGKFVEDKFDGKVMIVDFGGGTLDVSIVEIGDGVYEVKSVNGNTNLGGEDIDSAISEYIIRDIGKRYGQCLYNDSSTKKRILDAAKEAKENLSSCSITEINIPYLLNTDGGLTDYVCIFTQENLREVISDILDEIGKPIERALSHAHLSKTEIDRIVLVGGTTRIPVIRECLKKYFGKEPINGINPNTAVAIGAALQASVISGNICDDILLLDVTPMQIGLENEMGLFSAIIDSNSTIPTIKTISSLNYDKIDFTNIHVLQGGREWAKDNESIGHIIIKDLNEKTRSNPNALK